MLNGKFIGVKEKANTFVFTPESMVNEVFENPKAQRAFNEVFGGIFQGSEIAWMRGDKTLQFMAEFRDREGKSKLADFPDMLKKANELFLMNCKCNKELR